jgi:hypothetical protein
VWWGPWTDANIITGPYAEAEQAREAKRRLCALARENAR